MAAVAFSNVWIFGPSFFQCLHTLTECGLASLVDCHPAAFQVPISPGSVKLHPSKAVTSNAAPKAAGQFAPSVRLRCKRRGHLPFRRQDLPGALLVLAPGTVRAGASWPALGSLRSAVRLRRVHSARIRHATAWTPCHAGCFALRSRDAVKTCPQVPEGKWGTCEHVFLFVKCFVWFLTRLSSNVPASLF